MRHFPDPELPAYVSDRLSAVSGIPMQFLMSVGLVAVIMVAASLTDFIPKTNGAAGFADAQRAIPAVGATRLECFR